MKESRLYSFIDKKSAFTLHFLNGAKLMKDIKTIHNIGPIAYKFYRKVVLSAAQMTNFMKATENMGFYIDSEEPYFRFKIEMNSQGRMRTLLLPEEFESFPDKISGKTRVTKSFPNRTPYSSVINLEADSSEGIANKVLKESYQTKTEIKVAVKDFSLMFSKLPPSTLSKKFDEIVDLPLEDFIESSKGLISEVETVSLVDEPTVIDFFTEKGFIYLGSKEVKFFCPCSKERMVTNLLTLGPEDLKSVFTEKSQIEIRCDYCNSTYEVDESELKPQ